MEKVLKRDGTYQPYDRKFIARAIANAAAAVDVTMKDLSVLVDKVEKRLEGKNIATVAEIQDIVEQALMVSKYKTVAKAYIEYRHERDVYREGEGKLLKDINSFLERTSEEFTNENTNKDSLAVNTHRDLIAGIVSKHFAVTQLLPKPVANAHKDGWIHVHDADYIISPLTNCCLVNYPDMLENGFKLGDAEIEQPKSIGVASTVVTQVVQAVSSSQYGKQNCRV